MNGQISKKSIILWSISIALLLGVLLVLFVAEDHLEQRIKNSIDEAYPNLCTDIDLSLISRRAELNLVDTAEIQIQQHNIVIHNGSILMKGISWWKLFFNQHLKIKRVTTSMSFASVRTLPDTQQTIAPASMQHDISIALRQVHLISDSLSIKDNKNYSTGLAEIDLTDLHYNDSLNYNVSMLNIHHAGTEDEKERKWAVGEIRMMEDSLVLTDISVLDKEPSTTKRLYINGSVEKLIALGSTKKLWQVNPKMDSLIIEGFTFQLDELGQRKRCDGKVSCIKKHMSHVLLDLPIIDYISASGGLAYRYYKEDRIASEFTIANAIMAIDYELPSDQAEEADRLSFYVNALFNRAIPVEWSGSFDRGENFEYTVETESFSMQELNPLLPKFEGYSIAIAKGMCDGLKMAVSGRHTQSTSKMWITYNDFKLDIKKDESIGTRILDWASKTFVNNNHDSEDAFVREITYDRKYSFFYQLGDHLNNSCQAIMIEDWARRFL